ncbi:MAG: 30S ribosomal protein THX [Bacteroidia bacterium]|nr:30S ribosomal protein THX [Bacteroidia bacterium]
MGKGDRKSRKGKIQHGSFGVRRPRKKHKTIVTNNVKEIKLEKKKEVKFEAQPEKAEKLITAKKQEKVQEKEKTKVKAKVKETSEPKAETKAKKKKEKE